MGCITLAIHPLFFLFGLYYALTGKIFVFVMVTACALLHELGHTFCAQNQGYKLNKITLMPFGAVVDGNIDGIKPFDEIKIALAGPFINIAVGIFFVAVWWIYPQAYPYTDLAVETCFTLAIVNFIPAYPLDGGRILNALLREKLGVDKAQKITKTVGIILAVFLLICFIATCFYKVNLSLLFFALFVFVGVISKKSVGRYVRIFDDYKTEKLKNGMVVKRLAVDKSVTVKKLLTLLDENSINEVSVFDGEKPVTLLTQKHITEIVKSGDLYSPISKYLALSS